MICLINDYAVFTLYYQNTKYIEFVTFLKSIIKEGIKLLIQYLKSDTVLYIYKYSICIYIKNIFIGLIGPNEDIMVRGTTYHFYCVEDKFK